MIPRELHLIWCAPSRPTQFACMTGPKLTLAKSESGLTLLVAKSCLLHSRHIAKQICSSDLHPNCQIHRSFTCILPIPCESQGGSQQCNFCSGPLQDELRSSLEPVHKLTPLETSFLHHSAHAALGICAGSMATSGMITGDICIDEVS